MITTICLFVIIFAPQLYGFLREMITDILPDKKHGGEIGPFSIFILWILCIIVEIKAISTLINLYADLF